MANTTEQKLKKESILKKVTDKLYGGLNMSWLRVIIFALITAVLTAVILIIPIFEKTSFHFIGVTAEAWIFFAIIIMTNCKSPLESALKTFVFFLISQPLIYLIQVPFNPYGWGIFGYYKTWFIATLFTFPAAFIGYYLRKKNWVSLIILSPVLYFLSDICVDSFKNAAESFPYQILRALFCLAQVLIYLYTFTDKLWEKLAGFFVPFAAVIIIMLLSPGVSIDGTNYLPDEVSFSESAVIKVENEDIASVSFENASDGLIRIKSEKYGTTDFTVKDGEKSYNYTLRIYKDDSGHNQTEITKK